MEYRVKEKQVRDWRQEKDTDYCATYTRFLSQKKKGVQLILPCDL